MKVLVSYFSASGVTKRVASQLSNLLHADLEEIRPNSAYTNADLNWRDANSRSSIEMKDENSRPKIQTPHYDLTSYDIIFLGYPIWWYVEPRIIDTYLDNFNLKGKKIIPFATSGGSLINGSINHLRKLYPTAEIKEGLLLNRGINENIIKTIINGGK